LNIAGFNITKDIIELIVAVVIGISTYRTSRVSKRVEEGMNKINDLQYYNKDRKKIAKELEIIKEYLTDNSIDITNVTYYSKIQTPLSKIELYNNILSRKEKKKIDRVMSLIIQSIISTDERKEILECVIYFCSKLLKGDILI